MSEIKSFKGINSSEVQASLEQVIVREKKLMFLVPDGSLLLSDNEQEKLWEDLSSLPASQLHWFRHVNSCLYHYSDKEKADTLLESYRSGPDLLNVIKSRDLALRILSGDTRAEFEVDTNDGIQRKAWNVKLCTDRPGDEMEDIFSIRVIVDKYLLAITDIPPPERQNDDCHIDTPEHQVMVAVHNEFWAGGAGEKAQKIIEWIETNFKSHRIGKERIKYIEKFCRPENRRTGGRERKMH